MSQVHSLGMVYCYSFLLYFLHICIIYVFFFSGYILSTSRLAICLSIDIATIIKGCIGSTEVLFHTW